MKNKKHKTLPPTYFYTFIVISILLHFLLPIRQIVFSPWIYLGIIPIIFGSGINIWADRLFKQNKTTENPFKNPKSLVTIGPFRICRHPMYLGMLTILIGISLILGSIIVFIFPLLFFIIIEVQFISYEEKNMVSIFKNEYLEYKKQVRRWL